MSPRRTEIPEHERIYIRQASELLDRRMGTLRKWEALGVLPHHLRPMRGKRDWRYWSPRQIEQIADWLVKTDRRPGRGLPHIDERNLDPEKVREQIRAMRKPRMKKTIPAREEPDAE